MTTVRVEWHNPNESILYYKVEKHWEWVEFYDASQQVSAMAAAKRHRVHLIIDYAEHPTLPKNALLHLRNLAEQLPGNMGMSILVSTSPAVYQLYSAFLRVYGKLVTVLDVRFVDSIDEAVGLVQSEANANL